MDGIEASLKGLVVVGGFAGFTLVMLLAAWAEEFISDRKVGKVLKLMETLSVPRDVQRTAVLAWVKDYESANAQARQGRRIVITDGPTHKRWGPAAEVNAELRERLGRNFLEAITLSSWRDALDSFGE